MKGKLLKALRIVLFICLVTVIGKVGVCAMARYRVEGKSIIVNAPNPADFCESFNFIEENEKTCDRLVVAGTLDIQDFFNLEIVAKKFKFLDFSGLKNQILPNNYLEAYSKLEELILPENLKTVPYKMCNNCENLRIVVLSKKLKVIDEGAFAGCKKLILKIPKNVKIGKRVGYNSPHVELPIPPSCTIL